MHQLKFMLTIKLEENERHSLFAKETTSRKSKAVPQRAENPIEAKVRKESISPETSQKRSKKRTADEVAEDDNLWDQLKSEPLERHGEIKRSKRQYERLEGWKDKVESTVKYEAMDERNIKCSFCNVIFTVNKFSAFNDLGKDHKKCEAAEGPVEIGKESNTKTVKQENLLHFFNKK